MKRALLGLIALVNIFTFATQAQYVTLTGQIQGSNGVVADNYTLSFTPNQWFYVAGESVVISTTSDCATSVDGSVVGLPNPLQSVVASAGYTGTLPAGNYYLEYTFYTNTTETLPSAEVQVQLTSTGQIDIASPAGGVPSGALGMRAYIGTASGTETGQGQTVGNNGYAQTVPLGSGVPVPTTNTTVCTQVANDAGWPTGTGYKVALADSSGNVVPGYPMLWQLLGPNTTINLSNGLPYYHGVVTFPSPILASPYNHNAQSISGPISMSGYNLVNVNRIGVGTALPAYPVDVENGYINTNLGYLFNGSGGTVGQVLVSNGTRFGPGTVTPPTLYYQHIESNASFLPQEPYFNFVLPLQGVDNPSSARTDISLANSGVTAGAYTNANMTVDSFGRVTAATSGAAALVVKALIINSGICTTGSGPYEFCYTPTSGQNTWSTPFVDANYSVTCTAFDAQGTNAVLGSMTIHSQTNTGFVLTLQNGGTSGAEGATTVNQINCTGVHP